MLVSQLASGTKGAAPTYITLRAKVVKILRAGNQITVQVLGYGHLWNLAIDYDRAAISTSCCLAHLRVR